jgi:selenide,water dikinase
VALEIHLPSVPFLHGARRYAELGCFAGGTVDNRDYFQRHVRFDPTIDEEDRMLLFDAQTSGGLLLSMHAEKAAEYRARAQSSGITVWPLGKVVDGEGITVFDTPFEG